MGYTRINIPYPAEGVKNHNRKGYEFKLCPYSTAYRDNFTVSGTIITGIDVYYEPIEQTGSFVMGNSTDLSLYGVESSTYNCSAHTTMSGRMLMMTNPPGWICEDPSCYFYITYGRYYTEV